MNLEPAARGVRAEVAVAIVGGGPAGAMAALTLQRAGVSVVVIDTPRATGPRIGESLPSAALELMKQVEVESVLVSSGSHGPCYGSCSAWGSRELMYTDSIRDPRGHGWHLDRRRFDADMLAAVVGRGIEVVHARVGRVRQVERVERVERVAQVAPLVERGAREDNGNDNDLKWKIETTGPTIFADWLIDASGRSSAVARQCGAKRLGHEALAALVLWGLSPIDPQAEPLSARTVVESAPEGWWYTAKLPGNSRVLAFHTDHEVVRALRRDPSALLARAEQTEYVRKCTRDMKVKAWSFADAGSTRLDRCAGEMGQRWIAVGDAAMAFDPLSSQGIYNALHSGWQAALAIAAHPLGSSAGDKEGISLALARYQFRMDQVWEIYETRLRSFYAQEARWKDRPFWQKRRQSQNDFGRLPFTAGR